MKNIIYSLFFVTLSFITILALSQSSSAQSKKSAGGRAGGETINHLRETGESSSRRAAFDAGTINAPAANPVVRFRTILGNIDVELLQNSAPLTVANFLGYVNRGDYVNSFIHRSVPGFVIQGGGYKVVNNQIQTIPAQPPVMNEFHVSNTRGTLAMAKLSNDPNSATSQWFFNLADNSANLDNSNGGYTVFGRVTNANSLAVMDAVAALQIVNAGSPFDQLPVINYSGGDVNFSNLVTLYSINVLTSFNRAGQTDFDGDGKSDLSVFRPSNAVWYSQNSTNGFSAQAWGLSTDKLTPADFDGDGKTDTAVWREDAANPDFSYFYILQSATGTVRAAQFGRINDNPYFSGDWDGDGIADPAVFRDTGSGQTFFYYQPSAQVGVKFVAVAWGISGDKPVRGDFDGDGRQDAAVFRPSNGVWYILQSSNNQLRAESWGTAGDKLIAADYDGDGKTDLAVLRGTNWYIRQSTDAALKAYNWGTSTDTSVPADYDGDGKTDIAVYRSGAWYIIQSSNSQIRIDNFGQAGDIPIPDVYVR